MFFPQSNKNGILKSLHTKNNKYYNDESLFSYSASKIDNVIHTFDFIDSTAWVDNVNIGATTENYIDFCFAKGIAKLIGCEITTFSGTWYPYQWSLSGSNDRVNWKGNTSYEHRMTYESSYYFNCDKGTFKCYRINFLRNVIDSQFIRGSDINQIEVFGYYYPNGITISQGNRCTNNRKTILSSTNCFIIIFSIYS